MNAPEGWQVRRFDELGTLWSGSTPSSNNSEFWDGNIVWVTPADLSRLHTPYIHDSAKRITERGLASSSTHLLLPGSIVLSSRAPIGYVAIPTTSFCTNQGCKSIELGDAFDSEFVYYAINFVVGDVKRLGEGTTFAEISKKALAGVELMAPVRRGEQSKIAEVLSTVDRAIAQTEALIAKQQRIKTGLMQDLLTRGIDEAGQLRSEATHAFKDSPLGRIPVEWEVKELAKCVEFLDGKRVPLKQDDRDSMQGNIPYYGASGIIDFINRWIFNEELILLGEDGENVVSRNLPLAFKVAGRCWINNHAHVLRPLADNDIDFLVERLEFYDYSLLVSGSAQPKLNQRNLRDMHLPIPEYHEQRKIASTIASTNERISIYDRQLKKAKYLKTALMQDLLTGKVRVTPLLESAEVATA